MTAEQLSTEKTVAEVERLNPQARLKYLMECWGMSMPRIVGRLIKGGQFWWLQDITDTEGRTLEYPLTDLRVDSKLSKHGQILVAHESHDYAKHFGVDRYVSAGFELGTPKAQKDKRNPLLIRAVPESVEMLRHIPADRVLWREDGGIGLEEPVFHAYFEEVCEAKNHEVLRLQREIDAKKQSLEETATELRACERERDNVTKDRTAAEHDLSKLQAQHRSERDEIESGFASRRKQLEQEAHEQETSIKQRHDDVARVLREQLSAIKDELAAARKQRDREIGEIKSQADALRSYARERAELLRRLELITDAQWDALFPSTDNEDARIADDGPVDPPVEPTEAIDHIQRYLFGLPARIGYPWALLANFHALIETGDLIILSGLSGSGKTNLVKAYARATGNEPKIIPVKPNWTSAEDLLGFYNPLQASYATTPFLDALFEARKDPERLYILCLDEMNLARVEYYFADFLSRLENRKDPVIDLYSDTEAGHVLSELRVLMQALHGLQLDLGSINLQDVLAEGSIMPRLAERLGLGDGESFPQLHARLRRMLSGAISVPPTMRIPPNVRFVGAVNMDDTTHYLSPKVLDRAHVLRFQSPLDYWQRVHEEIGDAELPPVPIRIPFPRYPELGEYRAYEPSDPLVRKLTDYAREFLAPLGIELGMRPLQQAMLYRDRLAELYEGEGVHLLALNNLLRQKVLPRFSFEGKRAARDEIVQRFHRRLEDDLERLSSPDGPLLVNAADELKDMIQRAEANDGVYNYWA